MLLADRLMAYSRRDIVRTFRQAGHKPPDGMADLLFYDFDRLKPLLMQAQKFVIDEELTRTLYELAQTRPSSLVEALPFARAPYRVAWFEWPGHDAGKRDIRKEDGAPIESPDSLGILIETRGPNTGAGIMHLAWGRLDGSCEVSRVNFMFDFGEGSDVRQTLVEHVYPNMVNEFKAHELRRQAFKRQKLLTDDSRRLRTIAADDKEFEAFSQLEAKYLALPSAGLLRVVHVEAPRLGADPAKMLDNWLVYGQGDWVGEIAFIQAALIMLNSRNGTEVQSSDLRHVNKVRRREGKRPMFEHKVLKLALRHSTKSGIAGTGTVRASMRVHLVRGHFKVRKTGVFWWSPFSRGHAKAGVIEKDYVVAS